MRSARDSATSESNAQAPHDSERDPVESQTGLHCQPVAGSLGREGQDLEGNAALFGLKSAD